MGSDFLTQKNNYGLSYATAILMVVIIFFIVMLAAIWPKGKSFEEATGFDKWQTWQEVKVKIKNWLK